MKAKLFATALVGFMAVTSSAAYADDNDAKVTGLVGGAAVGAVVGGPVGAVVGGAVGLTAGAAIDNRDRRTVIVRKHRRNAVVYDENRY